ncbi:MAG: type I methionyl aminopeptidase [Oscillospiraceae bacterium]|nr:type I methionyl aminopeptidase [Oscillospiraceae bacterium]
MILLKSSREIETMRLAGRLADRARRLAGEMVAPGVTTAEIDREVQRLIEAEGAVPAFLGYRGYPKSVCISVNEEVIHGIPGKREIRASDLVSVDVGVLHSGFYGDCAATFWAGVVTEEAQRLAEVARESFFAGFACCKEGYRISDVSHAIQAYAEQHGFSVVRDFVGHGIGRSLHESPEVPNYGEPGRGVRLRAGMTLAIEPMINAGGYAVRVLADDWTVVTADGSLSAHYENTVLITDGEPEILTASNH